jgi:hypothetical protein
MPINLADLALSVDVASLPSFPWTGNGDVGKRVDCFLDMARGAILPFRRSEYRKEQYGREDKKADDD